MKRNIKHKCKTCKYTWSGYLENPKACPNCKSRDWKNISHSTLLKRQDIVKREDIRQDGKNKRHN